MRIKYKTGVVRVVRDAVGRRLVSVGLAREIDLAESGVGPGSIVDVDGKPDMKPKRKYVRRTAVAKD